MSSETRHTEILRFREEEGRDWGVDAWLERARMRRAVDAVGRVTVDTVWGHGRDCDQQGATAGRDLVNDGVESQVL